MSVTSDQGGAGLAEAISGGGRGRLRPEVLFTNAHPGELKGTSVRGGAVTVIAHFTRMVVQTGAMMIIARLLSPEDFGLQGEVVAITGIIGLFRDAGLSVATVQRPVITHEETSTLFWINVAVGTLLMLIVASSAPVLVRFFNEPRLFWMTVCSSLVFLINGLYVQHQALLQRSLRFTTIAKLDLMGLTLCSVVGVGMAWLGLGYWTLVGMTLCGPIVSLVGTWWIVPWMPGRPRHGAGVTSSLHFGSTITFNMLLVYLAYNADRVFLGRVWGSEAVGLYTRAYQVVNQPVQQLNSAIFNVAFPALSRIQNDAALLCRSFLKGYSIQLAINTPITICTALFAGEIIRVLLGPKWLEASPALVLLAPAILGFSLINPLGWFMMATGQAARSLRISYLLTPTVILGILLGVPYGFKGVAIGFSTAVVALVLPIVIWALHGSGITLRDYFDTVKLPLLAGLLASVCGWLLKHTVGSALPSVAILFGGSGVVCALYAFLLLIVFGQKPMYVDLMQQVLRRKSRAKEETQTGLNPI